MDQLITKLVEAGGWEPFIFETRAEDVDSFFTCEFTALPNGAEQAVRILVKCFDKASNKWKVMHAPNVDGEKVRVYLGADEPPRDTKVRTSSKRLVKDWR